MSQLQTIKTMVHEIAHSKLHAIDKDATPEEKAQRPDQHTREVQRKGWLMWYASTWAWTHRIILSAMWHPGAQGKN